MERHLFNNSSENPNRTFGNLPISELDTVKIWSVVKRYLPLVIIIFIVCNLAAYLKIRWTKPLYESYSDIKLDIKSEASLLGFNNIGGQEVAQNNLEGEIEIIRSRLFSNKVIEVLNLETSYYNYGNVLNEERYKSAPFVAEYLIKDPNFYDRNFDVEIVDEKKYRLSYFLGKEEVSREYLFGEKVENDFFRLMLHLKKWPLEKELKDLRYFFRANSQRSLIAYLESNLKVEPWNYNANIIRISFRDHNLMKAADLVNAIDTLYLKYTEEEKNKVNLQKINFLNEQLRNTESQLEEYEHYLENFTITNRTVDLNMDLSKTIAALESVDSARLNLAIRFQKLQELEHAIASGQEIIHLSSYKPVFPSSQLGDVFEKYNELIVRKKLLANTYSAETFAFKKIEEELVLMQEEINFSLSKLKSDLNDQQTQLVKKKLKIEEDFISLPAKGTDFNKVKRYYSLYEQFYLSMMQKKAEFEIAQAGTSTDFKVLSAASNSIEPISPNKVLIYGIGLALSLLLIVFVLTIGYLVNNKISSQAEVERLTNTPVIGSIPYAKHENDFTTLMVDKRPKSALSESLRSVRTSLDFFIQKAGNKVLTVTSTVSGEGKTFIAVNLGGVLSFSGNKVIILDLDMRKPKVHRAFQQTPSEAGLSTILIGRHQWKDCVFESAQPNLYYIQSGPTPPNPSELLMNDRFDSLLQELKKEYNYVILDTPPVGLVTDGIIAMMKSDLQLYVVRADYSKRSYLSNIKKLQKTNDFKNIGIIINSLRLNKNGYGYGYGNGYGYYEESTDKQNLRSIFKFLARK